MNCAKKGCWRYDKSQGNNCALVDKPKEDCEEFEAHRIDQDALAEVQCNDGLSDITPLEISALAQRIISNTTELAKISFDEKLAIQNRASYYAIEQIEMFLKENGR